MQTTVICIIFTLEAAADNRGVIYFKFHFGLDVVKLLKTLLNG